MKFFNKMNKIKVFTEWVKETQISSRLKILKGISRTKTFFRFVDKVKNCRNNTFEFINKAKFFFAKLIYRKFSNFIANSSVNNYNTRKFKKNQILYYKKFMLEKIIRSYVLKQNNAMLNRKFYTLIYLKKIKSKHEKKRNIKIVINACRLVFSFKFFQRQVEKGCETKTKKELAITYRSDRLCQKFFNYFNGKSLNKMRLINLARRYYKLHKLEIKNNIFKSYKK